MRDVKRIDRILKSLEKKWKKHPDMRFYQLMINIGLIPDSALWEVEDDVVEEWLKNRSKI